MDRFQGRTRAPWRRNPPNARAGARYPTIFVDYIKHGDKLTWKYFITCPSIICSRTQGLRHVPGVGLNILSILFRINNTRGWWAIPTPHLLLLLQSSASLRIRRSGWGGGHLRNFSHPRGNCGVVIAVSVHTELY